jgi:diaminopimelate epimerase
MISYSKYAGCGNDFILIDNRLSLFPNDQTPLIQQLCERRTGIGADGLILLQGSQKADFRMRIFNADGTEAEMCGNGLRCLMPFLKELGCNNPTYTIESMQRIHTLNWNESRVTATMGDPVDMAWGIELTVDGMNYTVHYLNTGVPHVILFVKDIKEIPVEPLGRKIRYHPRFSPRGANVNFVEKQNDQALKIRTYERGVEGETLACGTGATASAIAAALVLGMEPPITIVTRSKERLTIDFTRGRASVTDVKQTGPATFQHKGTIDQGILCRQN